MIASKIDKARYIMLGGFLGAGKTTAVAKLGRYLLDKGLRVGMISNDQSTGLVDTTMLRSKGFDVEEISGGCFCCRFDSLLSAANKLTAETRPDVFVAEPVGSCTDLVATVSYPLRRIYGDQFSIAPLSVLVDPIRGARILGLTEGRSFSSKVAYVYKKQLEEADLIVINKCDAVAQPLRTQLANALKEHYPRATVLGCSARDGDGLDDWFDILMREDAGTAPTMSIDYATYAEGEALLGWLNCTVRVTSEAAFDGNQLLLDLTTRLRDRLRESAVEIAHLKMTLSSGEGAANLSVVSLVNADDAPDLRESVLDQVYGGELIINLRAEADPELLKSITLESLQQCSSERSGLTTAIDHLEQFRPGKPEPTHRMTTG